MAEQVVTDPQRIYYSSPFKESGLTFLRLINPSSQYVIFKMKSTRPERFKMRPVYGYLTPHGGSSCVRVFRQPFDEGKGFPANDRVTVVLLQVPRVLGRASRVWAKLGTTEIRNCRRIIVPVRYEPRMMQIAQIGDLSGGSETGGGQEAKKEETIEQLLAQKEELLKQLQEVMNKLDEKQHTPKKKRPVFKKSFRRRKERKEEMKMKRDDTSYSAEESQEIE